MWEDLKVYKSLDKKEVATVFKKFGNALLEQISGYSINQTASVIKIYRVVNQLEQAVFIEKGRGVTDLKVATSIKPIDFYMKHRFTMLNIVPLGEIMNNHRRTSFPLTQEWNDLAIYLATRIETDIENYFRQYDSYEKIIENRKDIEPKGYKLSNKYELLIYAAIKTKQKNLLLEYLDEKIKCPVMRITQSEYSKSDNQQFNELDFLEHIKKFAEKDDFERIEKEILLLN